MSYWDDVAEARAEAKIEEREWERDYGDIPPRLPRDYPRTAAEYHRIDGGNFPEW